MSKRSSSMSTKFNSKINLDEGEENNKLVKNPYYNEYNYGYAPVKYDDFISCFDNLGKKGYNFNLINQK